MNNKQTILAGRMVRGMTFSERAWAAAARVPRGKVTTYGTIAAALGKPRAARAVGGAMNRNPFAPDVPCHRVVGAGGVLGGFGGGVAKKKRLLRAEGITFIGDRIAPEHILKKI